MLFIVYNLFNKLHLCECVGHKTKAIIIFKYEWSKHVKKITFKYVIQSVTSTNHHPYVCLFVCLLFVLGG